MLERAIAEVPRAAEQATTAASTRVHALRDTSRPAAGPAGRRHLPRGPRRAGRPAAARLVTASRSHALLVERERALYGAWYEIFPRSEGATQRPADRAVDHRDVPHRRRSGCRRSPTWASTSSTSRRSTRSARRQPQGAATTPSTPAPHDPGSPYAIGSAEGGHDAIHPDLGHVRGLRPLRRRGAAARARGGPRPGPAGGPDHPWVHDAPRAGSRPAPTARSPTPRTRRRSTRTSTRSTSTTTPRAPTPRCAGSSRCGSTTACKIFRVDNPHTKPVQFWQWLIAEVGRRPPRGDLAGRGVHPAGDDAHARQGRLPAVATRTSPGATRSGSSRSTSRELAGEAADLHAPDLLADDARHPHALHAVRRPDRVEAARRAGRDAGRRPTASTPATSWSSTSPGPASRSRSTTRSTSTRTGDWADYEPGGPKEGQSLAPYLTRLNEIRARAPGAAAGCATSTSTPPTTRTSSCYSQAPRQSSTGRDDIVIVVANLDPHGTRETRVHLDMPALGHGLRRTTSWRTTWSPDQTWHWGEHAFVRLGPDAEPVHIIHVRRL